jgi:hemoglobin/transferrin/lactoferrin receptor protein
MNILISGRLDYHSVFKVKMSPRIAFNYKFNEKLALRASVGTAYRSPATMFVYNSLAFVAPSGEIVYDIVPNPDLKEEDFLAAEIGFRWKPSKTFRLDAIAYAQRISNQFSRSIFEIDPELYPNAINDTMFTTAFVNNNDPRADLFGLQLNAKLDNLVESIGFDLDIFLTLSKGQEILPYDAGKLDNYRQWPNFMGQVNLTFNPWGQLYLYLRNNFSGKTYRKFLPIPVEIAESLGYKVTVPGYYTLDFIGRINLGRNLEAFARVNNVFNARYGGIDAYESNYNLLYNPQHGRHYALGLSFIFE